MAYKVAFSHREFSEYPRRLEVLELLCSYLNLDELSEFYFNHEDCMELIERCRPRFLRKLWKYDRRKVTVRSYQHRNRQPETIACDAAAAGHLPALLWGWDHYPEQIQTPLVTSTMMRHAIRDNHEAAIKFLLENNCRYDIIGALSNCNSRVFRLLEARSDLADNQEEVSLELLQSIFESSLNRRGDLEMLEYFLGRGVTVTVDDLCDAASHSLKLLVFLWDRIEATLLDGQAYESILGAIGGYSNNSYPVEVFKYILSKEAAKTNPQVLRKALEAALGLGDSESVHIALKLGARVEEERGSPYSSYMDTVASYGNLELVQFLDANRSLVNTRVSASTLSSAAISGNLDLILWLIRHYGPIFQQKDYEEAMLSVITLCISKARDRHSVIQVMLDHGARNYFKCLRECMDICEYDPAKQLLDHAAMNGVVIDRDDLFVQAARSCNAEMLALLMDTEEGLKEQTYLDALRVGYHGVDKVKLIMKHCGDSIPYCYEILTCQGYDDSYLSVKLIRLLMRSHDAPSHLNCLLHHILRVLHYDVDFPMIASIVEELLQRGAQATQELLRYINDAEIAALVMGDLLRRGTDPYVILENITHRVDLWISQYDHALNYRWNATDNDSAGLEYLYQSLLEQVTDQTTAVNIVRRLLDKVKIPPGTLCHEAARLDSFCRINRMLRREYPTLLALAVKQ